MARSHLSSHTYIARPRSPPLGRGRGGAEQEGNDEVGMFFFFFWVVLCKVSGLFYVIRGIWRWMARKGGCSCESTLLTLSICLSPHVKMGSWEPFLTYVVNLVIFCS